MKEDKNQKEVPTFPNLVWREFACVLIVLVVLLAISLWQDAPLLEHSNPNVTPNPSKAPWYFVGLQELLFYFDPWLAGVTVPIILILALLTIPYLDFNHKGSCQWSFSKRRWAIIIFCSGFLFWFVLTYIGMFLRGPNWQFILQAPWKEFPPQEELATLPSQGIYAILSLSIKPMRRPDLLIPNISWKTTGAIAFIWWWCVVGVFWIGIPFALTYVFRKKLRITNKKNFVRAYIIGLYTWWMTLILFKILAYHISDIRYFLVTPWFNI